MRRFAIAGFVSCLSVLALACSASPEGFVEGGDDSAEETLGETQDALKNGGNMLGSVCRACGCSWVSRVVDNCTQFRCECPSVDKANCVVRAPGSVAASLDEVVVQPTTPVAPPIAAPIATTFAK
jgi:hypothetical protein